MKRLISTVGLTLAISSQLFASGNKHWSYEGDTGPNKWQTLDEHYAVCGSGMNQTPIDIKEFIEADLTPISFNYKSKAKEITHNGHTVQVNFKKGNSITVEGKRFNLIQYHFHTPSENHIMGKSFPMEVHFVHADKDGNLAVIGAMFDSGKNNRELNKLIKVLPTKKGETNRVAVNPLDLLPKNRDYYRFNGSLTTPPCSENVHWFVMKESVSISPKQIKTFEKAMHAPNNRPIQPTNARPVLK